jgi:hypothetical protein
MKTLIRIVDSLREIRTGNGPNTSHLLGLWTRTDWFNGNDLDLHSGGTWLE